MDYFRERYLHHRRNGICHRCRAPVFGAAYCPACVEARAARRREIKAKGLCPSCGTRPTVAGQTRCQPCQAALAEGMRRLRIRRKAEGRCTACGVRPAAADRARCERCLDAARRYAAGRKTEGGND